MRYISLAVDVISPNEFSTIRILKDTTKFREKLAYYAILLELLIV